MVFHKIIGFFIFHPCVIIIRLKEGKMKKRNAVLSLVMTLILAVGCSKGKPREFPDLKDLAEDQIIALEFYIEDLEKAEDMDDYIYAMNKYVSENAIITARLNARKSLYLGYGKDTQKEVAAYIKIQKERFEASMMALMPRLMKALKKLRKYNKNPRLIKAVERFQETMEVLSWDEIYLEIL